MNPSEISSISDVWYCLQRDKEIPIVKVIERIPKENISREDLARKEIKDEVDKFGYYDVVFKWSDEDVKTLERLTSLGYVEKRKDKVYKVNWYYDAYPYLPAINLRGSLFINLNQTSTFTHNYLTSKQFKNFVETAKLFKDGKDKGLHRHIKWDYEVTYFYETDIYEIKDSFFDAIFVLPNSEKNNLIIYLTEPFIQTSMSGSKKSYKKNWKRLKEIPIEDFLTGAVKVEPYVDTLEWKKKIKGYLIFEDELYTLLAKPEPLEKDYEKLSKLEFLDGGEFSANNMRASYFEDRIADHLRSNGYLAKTRLKYYGKEIDVFAEKIQENREIVVCECKLRFEDAPITIDELERFKEKQEIVLQNEVADAKFWFVVNTDKLGYGAQDYANKNNMTIKTVRLPKNWKNRNDWSVTDLNTISIQS